MGRTLLGIQAGRGMAALLVALFHAERALTLPQYVGYPALGGATSFGHAGVEFFFVLSGFIIYYVHHGDLGQPNALPRYVGRRVSRIYPPYWVVTAFLVGVSIVAHGTESVPSLGHLVQSLLLMPHDQEPMLGVAWTLEREMVFYVLFGLAILDWRLAAAGLVTCATVGWVPLPEWVEPLRHWGTSWYDLLFAVGIGAAWITLSMPMPQPRALAVLGIAAFLAAGLAENAGLLPVTGLPGRLAYGLASAAVIMGVAVAERVGQLRVGPALVLFGSASYSIYLVHSLVLGYAAKMLMFAGLVTRLPGWLVIMVVVAAAVAAGIVFHVWVERPLTAVAQRTTARLLRTSGKAAALDRTV